MEKKLLETKNLKEIKDIIYADTDFLTGIILVIQYENPLTKLVRDFPKLMKTIEFYRNRTDTKDLYDAFLQCKNNPTVFSLLLTKETAGIALQVATQFSFERMKECLTFPQTQESLDRALKIAVNNDITGPLLHAVKILLEKGAKFKGDFNVSVIIQNGYYYPSNYELATIILNREEAKDFSQPVKNSALFTALTANQLSLAERLLILGANPADSLDAACYKDTPEAVRLLLRYGADPNQNHSSALNTAVMHNKPHIVEALIEYKVNIHENSDSALRTACEKGYHDIAKILLAAGAKVSAKGQASICYAAKNGHIETVKLLLENGANPRVKNNQALEWARKRGFTNIVNVIQEWIQKQEESENED